MSKKRSAKDWEDAIKEILGQEDFELLEDALFGEGECYRPCPACGSRQWERLYFKNGKPMRCSECVHERH